MKYNKLNFGCGQRYSRTWTNIDFHGSDPHVQRVNLLSGFPFPESSFSAVYSSHVLEHFSRGQGRFLVEESHRVLRDGGLLRIVVPDLQSSCTEYLRILALPDGAAKQKLYSWIILELLDQMVRTVSTGEMGPFCAAVMASPDASFKEYVRSRTENSVQPRTEGSPLMARIRRLTGGKLATRFVYRYIWLVSRLLPRSLRSMVFIETTVGERHRWMYDEYSLRSLFEEVGFSEVRRVRFDESGIDGFNSDRLDCNADGQPYKNCSLYIEGRKRARRPGINVNRTV